MPAVSTGCPRRRSRSRGGSRVRLATWSTRWPSARARMTPRLLGALGGLGVSALQAITGPAFEAYAPAAIGSAVADLLGASNPAALVGPGSDRGVEVLAYVAARAGLPLSANVTAATPGSADSAWRFTRQRWGGSLLEDLEVSGATVLLTVAPHALEPESAAAPTTVALERSTPAVADGDLRARVTSRVPAEAGKVSLADARVVVGGGRGVGSEAGFAELDELAALLGGTVGVSRVVTSAGWRPHCATGRPDRHAHRTGPVHRVRHQRRDPAHRRLPSRQEHPGHQHRSRRAARGPRAIRRHRRSAHRAAGDHRRGQGRDRPLGPPPAVRSRRACGRKAVGDRHPEPQPIASGPRPPAPLKAGLSDSGDTPRVSPTQKNIVVPRETSPATGPTSQTLTIVAALSAVAIVVSLVAIVAR